MPPNADFQEIHRLVRENNRMLHAMRRNSFVGGILKFIIYAALLLAPLWFYMTYLNDTVQKMLRTVDQLQGTSVQAQTQLGSFEATWKQFESKLPGFMQSHSSSTTQ